MMLRGCRKASSARRDVPQRVRRKACVLGLGAVLGLALVCGPGVGLHGSPTATLDPAAGPAVKVLGLGYAEARAESRRLRRIRQKREAQRKEAEQRQRAADKELVENRIDALPASCAFDSFASFTSESEIHVCGDHYFRPYEEDGVKGFEGYPISVGRSAFEQAKARWEKARKKRLNDARKKLDSGRKDALESDCKYDSFASFAARSNVYTCGGVQFMQVQENGKIVFDRRGVVNAKTKRELAQQAKAKAQRRAKAMATAGVQGERADIMPSNCAYDSFASFLTSSNVYDCDGQRYRQNMDAGDGSLEKVGF
jgi:hypothetical protein